MQELCTLFDVNYLPRGLVMCRSLARATSDFRLRVLCLDDRTRELLEDLAPPHVETIPLRELEEAHPELLSIKPGRSRAEYAWTLTPATCLYALEREPELTEITYLDADLMFFSDPQPIFDELDGDSVLITPHRYAERWQHLEPLSGRYNVQFMTFRRDERGLDALHWWHERCVEWCFQRHEDGKFGDQKYLDDWPARFEGTHVLEHPGAGLAPWNVARYALSDDGGSVRVDGRPLVFFHYHGFHVFETPLGLRWRADYPITDDERRLLWQPYVAELSRTLAELAHVAPAERLGVEPFSAGETALRVARRVVPAPVRRPIRRTLDALPGRHGWQSRSVAEQHLRLVLEQLEHPEDVSPYRAFLEAIRALLHEFDLPEPARLLDFGCGVGHYSELLERYFPGRFSYTGCDYSEEMVTRARRQWPGRQFVVNDLFANRLDLGDFDVVVASALVDVLVDWETALDILLGAPTPYVLLHRQRMAADGSRVERARGYRGQRTFASYLSTDDLDRLAARHSRRVARTVHVDDNIRSFILPLVPSP